MQNRYFNLMPNESSVFSISSVTVESSKHVQRNAFHVFHMPLVHPVIGGSVQDGTAQQPAYCN